MSSLFSYRLNCVCTLVRHKDLICENKSRFTTKGSHTLKKKAEFYEKVSQNGDPSPRTAFMKSLFRTLTVLGPEPAFGRLGLGGSSGGNSFHGYTSHASLRTFGAQLGGENVF